MRLSKACTVGLDRKVVRVGPACRAGHGVIQDATRGLELQPKPVCLLLDRITIKACTVDIPLTGRGCWRGCMALPRCVGNLDNRLNWTIPTRAETAYTRPRIMGRPCVPPLPEGIPHGVLVLESSGVICAAGMFSVHECSSQNPTACRGKSCVAVRAAGV